MTEEEMKALWMNISSDGAAIQSAENSIRILNDKVEKLRWAVIGTIVLTLAVIIWVTLSSSG